MATVLAGCGPAPEENEAGTSTGKAADFPVTIDHTFGETTIEEQPERIVTLGWNAQDVVYALGQTPVGMPEYSYGANSDGVMPWTASHYDPAETELLDVTDGPPFEAIAKLRPDVILAPYEGFDKATYDKLSQIAPTVAYPDKAWQTSWQDQTTIIGKALGKSEQANKLVQQSEKTLSKTAQEHPEFADKTLTVAYFGSDKIDVYLPEDPRVQFLEALGFKTSPGVKQLVKDAGGNFFAELSWERVTSIDADVVVGYVDDMSPEAFKTKKPTGTLSAVQNDAAVILDDEQVIAGLSQPSVLSIEWTLGKILPRLSEAAKNAQ